VARDERENRAGDERGFPLAGLDLLLVHWCSGSPAGGPLYLFDAVQKKVKVTTTHDNQALPDLYFLDCALAWSRSLF